MCELAKFLVAPHQSVREVIACIDRNHQGIALVVSPDQSLLGTITDGDIRRAILAGFALDRPVFELLLQRSESPYPSPVTAPAGTANSELLNLMQAYTLRHIPLLDEAGRVVDLALLRDLVEEVRLPLTAVVMAGGFGKRLRPLTDRLPKPMLPVGDRPLLERTIENLRQSGISHVVLTTHYMADVITSHFGNGRSFGVDIDYLQEDQPMGTAGALRRVNTSNQPLLVLNGDILTGLDFRAMIEFHRDHKAEMTVAVREYQSRLPYGVVQSSGAYVTGIEEKPIIRHFINAGIYLLNPEVCSLIPQDAPYQMPELISRLVSEGRPVVSFPVREYWRDIGQIDDYEQAQQDCSLRMVS